jgi:hypothetical protein
MKRVAILAAVPLFLLGCVYLSLHIATGRAISRIEQLEGRTGEFAEVTKTIDTRYRRIDSTDELELARKKMGLATVSNLFVVRFNGEGFPYFYGYVGYDTGRQQVVRAVVERLW